MMQPAGLPCSRRHLSPADFPSRVVDLQERLGRWVIEGTLRCSLSLRDRRRVTPTGPALNKGCCRGHAHANLYAHQDQAEKDQG